MNLAKLLFVLLLLVGCASAPRIVENISSSSFECEKLVGTWFVDITINNIEDGEIRYIMMTERTINNEMFLTGATFYADSSETSLWAFPSEWWCEGDWYKEKNEWGDTEFKILSISPSHIEYIDARNNYNTVETVQCQETRQLKDKPFVESFPELKAHFGF